MRMRGLLVLVVLGLFGRPTSAQTVTSYTVRIYNVGAPAPAQPVSTTVIQATGFLCGQAKGAPVATVTNPTRLSFDDPTNATQDCVFKDNGSGPLLSLPFSNTPMSATIAATNSAGTSGESVASNSFTRPGLPPPAPTGPRVAP